jgi:hypothetical protein
VLEDVLWSAGALVILVSILVALDDRVRVEIQEHFSVRSTAALYQAESQTRTFATIVVDAARDKVADHTPLMLFAFAGSVLVLFMIRT